jgi:hypothetical protein
MGDSVGADWALGFNSERLSSVVISTMMTLKPYSPTSTVAVSVWMPTFGLVNTIDKVLSDYCGTAPDRRLRANRFELRANKSFIAARLVSIVPVDL